MIEIQKISDIMQHIDGLKAVIFDLDDTLYNEKEYVFSGYSAVAAILPQVADAQMKMQNAFENNRHAIDEVLTLEGIYTEELKQRCLEVYRNHFPDIHLNDDVLQVLEQLKMKGYWTGIITDGRPEGQRMKIKTLGLEKYFDHIIVTDELGGIEYRKPNTKAFEMMKELLGVEYTEMCYIGDNQKKDFVAPLMLKIKSIHIVNKDGIYYSEGAV